MFMRISVLELGAFATAGLRVAVATLCLLPLVFLQGQGAALKQHWKPVLFVGLLNSAIPFACFGYALLSISTGLSAILNATVPLFGALVAWWWLGDKPGGSRSVGLLLGFVGVAMLAWDKASFKPNAVGGGSGWAVLACLLATLCYGMAANFTKRYLGGVPSLVSAAGSLLGASLGLAPLAWWFWPAHAVSAQAWWAVAVLGLVCTALAYVLYFRLIKRAGPPKALAVTFAIPVFAVAYGVLLLGESVTLWMVLCAAVVMAGTSLSTGLIRLPSR